MTRSPSKHGFLDSDGAFCTKGDALVVADDDICHNHGSLDSWETSATWYTAELINLSLFWKSPQYQATKRSLDLTNYEFEPLKNSAEFLLGEICTVFFVCFFSAGWSTSCSSTGAILVGLGDIFSLLLLGAKVTFKHLPFNSWTSLTDP